MPLKDRLTRSILLAVGVAVLTVLVPAVLTLGITTLLGTGPLFRGNGALFLAAMVVLCAAGLGLGAWIGLREARRLADPFAALSAQADAIGRRRPPEHALDTDIAEIDMVSSVLRTRAIELTQQLAKEHELASNASHQLRTPLTALLIRLEEISLLSDPDEMRQEATVCIDQVERLTRVVDDLLRRTRSPRGEQPQVTSLDSVLAELQREWQPAFSKARRSIRIMGERGLRLQASRDDLAQMISTLLENALEHGHGQVEIDARRTGPSVVLEMTDQGNGVDPSLAPHIFERRVTTGGTGLGLALARDLAQSNGGRLELLDAQPARFALFLSEAPAAADDPPGAPDPGSSR